MTPVFELRQVFKICHTVACIRTALQYVQCCCSDLVSSSCAGDVGSSQEGVCRSRRCNLSLHQGLYPATSSQTVAERLQGGHLDVESTKHHHHLVFAILLWPLPLNLLKLAANELYPLPESFHLDFEGDVRDSDLSSWQIIHSFQLV